MKNYSLSHVSNGELLENLHTLVTRDRVTTVELLAHLGEVEARKLFAPAGYSSMHKYCALRLGLDPDVAYKRLHAARAARRFPQIFDALAQGRLTVTVVVMLEPHLENESGAELIRAAERKTKAEVELLLARRFPRADLPTLIHPIVQQMSRNLDLDPNRDFRTSAAPSPVAVSHSQPVPEPANSAPMAPNPTPVTPVRIAPLSAESYKLQVTIRKETHDLLREAQELLGRQVSFGNVAEVLHRALESFVGELRKRKFAATSQPRKTAPRKSANPRHIPARVKREVWKRDQGRCTFVGDGGRRCDSRRDLEFDHVTPVARGGEATASNLRLRCRTHNQLEAERLLGHALMESKRLAASFAGAGASST